MDEQFEPPERSEDARARELDRLALRDGEHEAARARRDHLDGRNGPGLGTVRDRGVGDRPAGVWTLFLRHEDLLRAGRALVDRLFAEMLVCVGDHEPRVLAADWPQRRR